MWAPSRRTAPPSPLPVAVNPPRRNMPADLRPSAARAGPESLRSSAPVAVEVAADVGAEQADRAAAAAAGGGEPAAEEHALADLQAVGDQGGAGVVAQLRPVAVEVAADVGAGQADRADVGVADDPCSAQAEHAAGEPFSVQGWLGGMFELASGQAEEARRASRARTPSSRRQSCQLQVDIRGEVFQVKPAGDPGTPKPQPMRVRVGHEPPTQDVADHARPAGPGLTPRPHRGLINRLIIGGQVEQFPPADVLDQRLLHRGQSPCGHLSDHPGTLTNVAGAGSPLKELGIDAIPAGTGEAVGRALNGTARRAGAAGMHSTRG